MVVFCGTFVCTGKGYVERETSLASLEREEALFRARFTCLSKVVVFCGTFVCTGKGYVERGTFLVSLKREGGTFQDFVYLPLKSGGFLWHFCVHRLGVCREGNFSCFARERERGYFSGLALLASQKWWFSVALLCAPVRGMVRGKLLSLHSRERGYFTGLALLASQKWWFSVALLCAPVRGM